MIKKFNWQIWSGFLLAVAGAVTYAFVFVDYPALRDFPWTALGFFALALGFLFAGFARAFAVGTRLYSKIAASIVGLLAFAVMGLFLFAVLIAARWLPESKNAPQVGQTAPEFSLPDINGKQVSLSELRSAPIKG